MIAKTQCPVTSASSRSPAIVILSIDNYRNPRGLISMIQQTLNSSDYHFQISIFSVQFQHGRNTFQKHSSDHGSNPFLFSDPRIGECNYSCSWPRHGVRATLNLWPVEVEATAKPTDMDHTEAYCVALLFAEPHQDMLEATLHWGCNNKPFGWEPCASRVIMEFKDFLIFYNRCEPLGSLEIPIFLNFFSYVAWVSKNKKHEYAQFCFLCLWQQMQYRSYRTFCFLRLW